MTLVVAINSPESIWMLTDRRLSFEKKDPKDDACKIMCLTTTDGVAFLGYAGLGATAAGIEPAEWMSRVLRGRNLPLEQSLGVLADAMKAQFPRHMLKMPGAGGPVHNVIITAFLGNEPRLYTIDFAFARDRKNYAFRYTRHVINKPGLTRARTQPVAIAGSGASYLIQDKRWLRSLLRVIRAHDRNQVSSLFVSDHLANLNNEVHRSVTDNSVGPRCIVAWRHRKGGVHNGGGAHQFYTGTIRDPDSLDLPTIANGTDLSAFFNVVSPFMIAMLDQTRRNEQPAMDADAVNAALARLDNKPDEKLR